MNLSIIRFIPVPPAKAASLLDENNEKRIIYSNDVQRKLNDKASEPTATSINFTENSFFETITHTTLPIFSNEIAINEDNFDEIQIAYPEDIHWLDRLEY